MAVFLTKQPVFRRPDAGHMTLSADHEETGIHPRAEAPGCLSQGLQVPHQRDKDHSTRVHILDRHIIAMQPVTLSFPFDCSSRRELNARPALGSYARPLSHLPACPS